MGSYIPSTMAERQSMLTALGKRSMQELFSHIPSDLFLSRPLDMPSGIAELEVRRELEAMSNKNKVFKTIFRGAGAYNHYIPSSVSYISAKEEFVTAYTPYQAEISQGLLQSIFEYQTMICALTGMDVANASVYDGATAASEAVLMCQDRGRDKVLVSAAINPETLKVVKTYCQAAGMNLTMIPLKDGVTDKQALAATIDETTATVLIQQPNYFGMIEDGAGIGEIAHAASAKYIMSCYPIALALLKTPKECGADIATGEGQPLGIPLSFGGPYLGYMACQAAMLRRLPGRIVGETTDVHGERAFVLTLQAREQHIRREKATSSICSNQALCALTASIYLGAMGPSGLISAAEQCHAKASYAAKRISAVPGFELAFPGPFFNEFVTSCPIPAEELMDQLEARGILGGYPIAFGENQIALGSSPKTNDSSGNLSIASHSMSNLPENTILWCVTEVNTKVEIDQLVQIIKEVGGRCN